MNEMTLMGMPGVGIIGLLIIGVLAGFIAEKVMKTDHGLLTNLIVGIVGSYIGGFIAQALGVHVFGIIGNLIFATIGAIILLFVWRMIKQRS
ncbi:MAG: GlsB/YeaQ/YmgE family stress response membrane protein [Fimbriimonadaceae bacterium]|nr:GlsB/YeaQ/YmgE family stress response membrane protein [Alphaproteobacteria bacterium]